MLFLCAYICFILIHFINPPLSSLFYAPFFLSIMLLSVTNLISCFLSLIVLITQFWLHKTTFPSLYRAAFLISSFLNFLIYISFLYLSSLCFVGSLLIALTARNQYIPFHISYPYFEPPFQPLPLILTHQSHNAIALITSTALLLSFILFFLILSTLLTRVQFH